MSIINQNLLLTPEGYQISRSVRLRSSASAYLNRTPASAGNRKTWTFSTWMKRGKLGADQDLLSYYVSGLNETIRIGTDDKLYRYCVDTGGTVNRVLLSTNAVLRDPSAWYHIVMVQDTTQATNTDRVKIYINGVQQSVTATVWPSLNWDGYINTAVSHQLFGSSGLYFDGLQTETLFIDGQALTPSSFGETDGATGVWKPKKYLGTYGTNGFYLPFNISATSAYAGSFSGSGQYLTVAASSALEFGSNNFTIEFWWYPTSTSRQGLYHGSFGTDWSVGIDYNGTGAQKLGIWASSNGTSWNLINADPSGNGIGATTIGLNQWHHIAFVRNGTTWQLYLDGKLDLTLTGISGTIVNRAASTKAIGCWFSTGAMSQAIGSISNFRILNGTALYTSNFVVPQTNLTAITNTQLLTLQNATIVDNSTNALSITNNGSVAMSLSTPFALLSITSDQSGNANNWNANNISLTAGVTYDSMLDVPTPYADGGNGRGNYAVLNPLSTGLTISAGNLSASAGAAHRYATSTVIPSSGKWYWEYTLGSTCSGSVQMSVGVGKVSSNFSVGTNPTTNGTQLGIYLVSDNGSMDRVVNGSSSGASATTVGSAGSIYQIAFDADNGKMYFGVNNTFYSSTMTTTGNPSAGTNETINGLTGELFAPLLHHYANSSNVNFGQRPFTYTPPTGFKALNTQNLPDSTIKKGNQYFDATLYTGNGANQTVVNSGSFQPDLVWTKNRGVVTNNSLVDSVRGVSLQLSSNQSIAEVTDTTQITGITSTGFSMGNSSGAGISVNTNANSYVGWQWQAGKSVTSSNTNGTITSTVCVGATQGFSVVTYTGNGITSATVGHGLGVTPAMVIVKTRSLTYDWFVRHQSLPTGYQLRLQSTAAQEQVSSATTSGGLGTPTSTVFNFIAGASNTANVNSNGATYVAYCFSEVAGFSKFGSYTGNGSTDGPFVYCNFRPKFLLVKNASAVGDWIMYDTSRNSGNVNTNELYPNLQNAEFSRGDALDILSNGFKIRTTLAASNGSGNTIIFMAFAENPFKNSLAR